MKGSFEAYPYLMGIEEQIRDREPFVFLSVSTTGIDNAVFSEHMPIRVSVKEYVYDKSVEAYEEKLSFDSMVKCSAEALQVALDTTTYDIFANAGIDRDAYARGEGVPSVEEFARDFNRFVEGLEKDALIIANGKQFCVDQLKKIGCDGVFQQYSERRIYDQAGITRDYFKANKVESRVATLDALNQYMQQGVVKDSERIIGTDARCDVMADFMVSYGRSQKLLYNDALVAWHKASKESTEHFVEKGKADYYNADFEKKFNRLLASNVLSEEVTNREYPCDLNQLYDILEGSSDKKGIIFMQCATTGFNAGDKPIQFTAMIYEFGEQGMEGVSIVTMDIQTDAKSFNLAVEEVKKGGFDAFKYTGINLSDYKNNIPSRPLMNKSVFTEEEAVEQINKFFTTYSPNDYMLISNGRAKSGDLSYTQNAISKIGNMAVCHADCVDFAQIIKEYSYAQMELGKKNAIIDMENIDGTQFKFSLEFVAEHNNYTVANTHTESKCYAMVSLIDAIATEMRKEKGLEAVITEEQEAVVEQMETQNEPTETVTPVYESEGSATVGSIAVPTQNEIDEEEVSFAYEGDTDLTTDDEPFELPTRDEVNAIFAEGMDYGSRTLTEQEKEQRELYSTVKNDSIPLVAVDGEVHKVAEVPIKHISEYSEPTVSKENEGAGNADISALIKAMTAQTEATNANTLALREQNDMLKQQNTELSNIIVATMDLLSKQMSDVVRSEDKISSIEQIKQMIDEIASNSDASVKQKMHTANAYLANAQKDLENHRELAQRE